GSWHPRASICVSCYDEVRRETNALRASLKSFRDGLPYDQETQFLYEQETFGKPGIFTHRVERKRPSWFPLNLLGLSSSESPSK
uniref:Beclin 1-associated autophagy-related key regulator n=1 Tax=Mesocestoides corti TaxID=53468 RepID=A0A5K3FIL6_MESCO